MNALTDEQHRALTAGSPQSANVDTLHREVERLAKALNLILAAYNKSGRFCPTHRKDKLRVPFCSACQVEARIEEAESAIA